MSILLTVIAGFLIGFGVRGLVDSYLNFGLKDYRTIWDKFSKPRKSKGGK